MIYDYINIIDLDIINQESTYQDYKPSLIDYNNLLRTEKKLTYKTIKTRFTALNNFFSYLVDEGESTVNPVPQFRERHVRTYKPPQKARTQQLETGDIELLIKTAQSRLWRAVIAVYALTGIRREELCMLDVGIHTTDFNLKMFYIPEHPKRTNERVPFTDQLRDLLFDYLELRVS
ncbi:hypothetical protein MsAc7_03350 [Methanolapillus millepedarum]|uniref:Core-binding (CB) domain-containing protein n=2 Tax=Methanolapillus millepedarum TaxID=3028296 RepID=A0AA96V3J9_9EURY|nr:hypothetical protein MsAc7_03350 [Methanosarcinaceae archaeon Ac7]